MNSAIATLPSVKKPSFLRSLLSTALSYLAWGYGALLLFFAGWGLYVLNGWLREKHYAVYSGTIVNLASIIVLIYCARLIYSIAHEMAVFAYDHEDDDKWALLLRCFYEAELRLLLTAGLLILLGGNFKRIFGSDNTPRRAQARRSDD